MASRVLITGAGGFIGQALCKRLLADGLQPIALQGNLLDPQSLEKNFFGKNYDMIVHLAGISAPPECEKKPDLAYQANVVGTIMLADAIIEHCPQSQLIFTSTAQVYQPSTADEVTLTETSPVLPMNVYSKSKLFAEEILEGYSRRYGLKTVILRLFNHSHASQAPQFVLPSFVEQLNQLKRREIDHLSVGNLSVERDFNTLQRLLKIFSTLLTDGCIGQDNFTVLNVCSGQPRSLLSLLQLMAQRLDVELKYRVDPARLRAHDPKRIVGAPGKLNIALDLRPESLTDSQYIDRFFEPLL